MGVIDTVARDFDGLTRATDSLARAIDTFACVTDGRAATGGGFEERVGKEVFRP